MTSIEFQLHAAKSIGRTISSLDVIGEKIRFMLFCMTSALCACSETFISIKFCIEKVTRFLF